MNLIETYWEKFLEETNTPNQPYTSWHFELNEKLANELLELVLEGKKKATAPSIYDFENEPLPEVGDYSVITNWSGEPKCIIQTTSVQILPFKDVTFELARLEGEDENLESWREGHIRYYTQVCKATNQEFTWEMPVVFEQFELVYK
ncbi:ASCH domain-containing protein [Bacillus sp. FJAT-49732]|uniref:ASCH domain-containing protein n=1 Tax=Lederbergia citrisecunda TaxID=2833583 RepID=A0A942TKX4_9BACI|nr:ASCH domain-containing protein [Lederbergia citrisecunda]MBS4198552.1 ASCH domain-containing protein [Lederbergia citrisecunda]